MVECGYCEKPLICDACGTEYVPPTPEHYEALSRPEVPLHCPKCEAVLVCHWCKMPYDGGPEGQEDAATG